MDQPDSVITNINQISAEPSNQSGLNKRSGKADKPNKDNNVLSNQSIVSGGTPAEGKASKRPKNTALKQQRLPAWQPILTAKTVLPLFFAVGMIFCALGGVLLHYSNLVSEKVIDYTDCRSTDGVTKCSDIAKWNVRCICEVSFQLEQDFAAPVYLYYGLSNFYQNHRRYVKSRDDSQLLGKSVTADSLNSECAPYSTVAGNGTTQTQVIAPCGAIANSLFNDTFRLNYGGPQNVSTPLSVGLLKTGIAWSTDKQVKFGVPDNWDNTVKPLNWPKPVQELDPLDPSNNGYKNEDLIVWMRTAALPSFRKLHRRIDHSNGNFSAGLPAGYYTVVITYDYPVTVFNGGKSFILSTTTWIGGKNPFLGIAYLVVGSLCIVLGFCFLIIHFKFSRNAKPNDDFVSKNNNVSTIGAETGRNDKHTF